MEVKTRAITLHTTRLGDNKLIVDLLTRETGRLSVICSVSRSPRAKIKMQLFQPLTILDACIDQRENRQLQRFKDVRLALPYTTLTTDPLKLSIAFFLDEFLNYATRDEQHNPLLVDYVQESLSWLDNKDRLFANFHLVFMMRLTKFIGFFPNLSQEGPADWFDLRNGTFSAVKPNHPDCLSPADAQKMRLLMRMNYDNMHLFKMTREERNRCTDLIIYYYRLHIPNFPDLVSKDVLHSLFA
jgi:DNA repair protein RecO (recombination protein O)